MEIRLFKFYAHLILAMILFQSCHSKLTPEKILPQNDVERADWLQVGFLIMNGVYNTELTAPYDIYDHTRFRDSITPMNVFTIANTLDPIKTFEGLRILPDYNYLSHSYPKIDILVIPSGEHQMTTDLEDKHMLDFVQETAQRAKYITSHCDGSFVLAKAGLLDNVFSTTFPGDIKAYKEMFPRLKVIEDKWIVHDQKYITSAGGARSFEAAMYLTDLIYGAEVTKQIAKGMVLDWDKSIIPIHAN